MKSKIETINRDYIDQIYLNYLPGFKPNGKKEVTCRCTFHEDKNPSLSVNSENGLFNCFSCGEKGNAIQFVQKRFSLNLKDSIDKIENDFGLNLDQSSKLNNVEKKTDKPGTNVTKKAGKQLTSNQITKIHNQLVNNPSYLKMFQDKYGLSLEIIKEYSIGYQNEKFVIPIETSKGKFTLKEHKGLQFTGSSVSLWPKNMLTKDLKERDEIIIVEGEFKALLLIQKGYCAVTSTTGAGCWQTKWNEYFRDKSVFLCFDNDTPGHKGSDKVGKNLLPLTKSLKNVKWPISMNQKDNNDVTDYFLKMKKSDEEFRKLLDNAELFIEGVKRLFGVRFREPENIEINNDNVVMTKKFKDGVEKSQLFPTPVLISKRAVDVDSNSEEIELLFKRDDSVRSVWLPRRSALDTKKVVEFCDVGLPVHSRNSGKFVDYLYDYECKNMDLIPKSYITKECGWKEIKDENVFVLGEHVINNSKSNVDLTANAELGFEKYIKALNEKGSYYEWKDFIENIVLKFKYSLFGFYASFVPPLLKILKTPNFIIDFWGGSSLGKTTTLEIAASVWGNPHKENGGLVFNWDSTRVFLERASNFFNDLPIFPDDSQTVENKLLAKILYMVANGAGRGRGSITGIRQMNSWRTVCFSTGEKPLTDCSENEGIRARVISLYGSPMPNVGGSVIEELKNCIRDNYGHAGMKFIKYLVSILDNEKEIFNIRREYSRFKKELALDANNEVGDRISQYFASVKIASDIVSKNLGIGSQKRNEETIYNLFKTYIADFYNNFDIGARAFSTIMSWVQENDDFFLRTDSTKKETPTKSYGVIKRGDYLGIYPHVLQDVLEKYNFSYKTVCKIWSERDWIRRRGKNMTYTVWINAKDQKQVIYIKWEIKMKFEDN